MSGRLQGKVAIVTGAGQGIGRAIALRFADEGAKVIVASRDTAEVDATVHHILQRQGTAAGVVVDVARRQDVERMVDFALRSHGRIDVLVNNAGVMDDFVPVADVTDELWERVLGVNLNGVFYACRLAVPAMLKQGGGAIVNIASIGGLAGARAGAAYTASKHAVIGLTRNVGYMYAQTGIRCNAIAPGGVATHIGANLKPHEFGFKRMSTGLPTSIRMAQPEELAAVALFLASDESSFVNGAVVTADGGWTAY